MTNSFVAWLYFHFIPNSSILSKTSQQFTILIMTIWTLTFCTIVALKYTFISLKLLLHDLLSALTKRLLSLSRVHFFDNNQCLIRFLFTIHMFWLIGFTCTLFLFKVTCHELRYLNRASNGKFSADVRSGKTLHIFRKKIRKCGISLLIADGCKGCSLCSKKKDTVKKTDFFAWRAQTTAAKETTCQHDTVISDDCCRKPNTCQEAVMIGRCNGDYLSSPFNQWEFSVSGN